MRQCRAVTIGLSVFAFVILTVGHAVAQPAPPRTLPVPVAGVPRDFDVDWHQALRSPVVLSGCVYNRNVALAERVRVGVEGLDANGAVVGSTAASVGNVPAGSYGHFELPVIAGATNYRITVLAYDWFQGR